MINKYRVDGAALFYTSLQPLTLVFLRQYVLHLLFTPPASSVGLYTNTETMAPFRNPFQISQKSNLLDRDRIFIPMGWDSWGKIAVLREGFNSKSWGEAWDMDNSSSDGEVGQEKYTVQSAKKMYSELVPDKREKVCHLYTLAQITEQPVLASLSSSVQQSSARTSVFGEKL